MKKKSREERHQFYMERDKVIDAYFTDVDSVVKQGAKFIQEGQSLIEAYNITDSALLLHPSNQEHGQQFLLPHPDKVDEDPCMSVAALLESEFCKIDQTLLQDKAYTILAQGNNVEICISASVSLDEVKEFLSRHK